MYKCGQTTGTAQMSFGWRSFVICFAHRVLHPAHSACFPGAVYGAGRAACPTGAYRGQGHKQLNCMQRTARTLEPETIINVKSKLQGMPSRAPAAKAHK